jgi:hypothetical protein
VHSWPRLRRSRPAIAFYYEFSPDTSLPLRADIPGIDVWTDDMHWTDLEHVRLGGFLGGGPASAAAASGGSEGDVRYLRIGKDAYKFLHRGDNHFYCAAFERHSRLLMIDYFVVHKV